jgi:hypothetical protein
LQRGFHEEKKKTENRKQTNNCKNTLSSSGLPAVTMELHFFLFRALQSQKKQLEMTKKKTSRTCMSNAPKK